MSDETQTTPGPTPVGQDVPAQHSEPNPSDSTAGGHESGAAEIPTGAPHFVAPSSYLRPLSRAQPSQAASGNGGSRPGTRDKKPMPPTPWDNEQIEGLVSFTPTEDDPTGLLYPMRSLFEGLKAWLTEYLVCRSVRFEPFSRCAPVMMYSL